MRSRLMTTCALPLLGLAALGLALPMAHAQQEYYPELDERPSFTLSGTVKREVEQQPQESGFVGLDMIIRHNRYPLIQGIFQGSPAHQQGLMPGDQIVAVDGVSTMGRDIREVDAMISNVPGTPVRLTLHRHSHMQEVVLIVAPINRAAQGFLSSQGFSD